MTELKKLLESEMKVRFHDCDPFNHLNNSRYIDYFMAARTDQLLDNYSFDLNVIAQEQGIGWVTAQTQISYLSPASVMEEVLIQSRLLSFSDRSLLFEGIMYSKDKAYIKAVMWTRLVHFNLVARQSATHPDQMMALFKQVVYPLDTDMSYEERVKNIRK